MPRTANREQARGRILEAAKRIFFAEGFAAANLDEVARVAGIAKGTIYRYFESKAELYVEVLAQGADDFLDHMRAVIDPERSAPDQIREIGRFYLRHWSENPAYFRIFWALENQRLIGDLPPTLVEAVLDVWKRGLEILAAQIRRGVASGEFRECDPWVTANILWTAANAVIQTEADPPRRAMRRAELGPVFESMVELLLRGLEPR